MEQFISVTLALLQGFGQTMNIFLLTLAFSIPLGLLVCFGTMSKFSPVRYAMKALVWVIRGTPLMLQLIVVFYGPGLLFGLPAMGRFTAVILGTLDPVAFGDSWYAAVAFITFGLLIVSNLIFWRTLFGRRADSQTQRRQRMLADIAACVTSLAMIQLVPRALDMFFWWD